MDRLCRLWMKLFSIINRQDWTFKWRYKKFEKIFSNVFSKAFSKKKVFGGPSIISNHPWKYKFLAWKFSRRSMVILEQRKNSTSYKLYANGRSEGSLSNPGSGNISTLIIMIIIRIIFYVGIVWNNSQRKEQAIIATVKQLTVVWW